jgi:3-oxoacyl-[acyl-carrier-protein] synthase II
MSAASAAAPLAAASPVAAPLAITASGVVSAAGFGAEAIADVLAGRSTPHAEPTDPDGADHPPRPVRTVAPFDRAALLGRKGTRNLDRLTQLGLIAVDQAIAALPGGLTGVAAEHTGVVVGTTSGSITTATDVGRDTLVHEKPYMVNPATFPNTVMNACSGQIAIRHGVLGVNAAVSGGALSWLLAVRYARTALACGRADRLLVGAVEEVTARTAWAWHLTGHLHPEQPLGEGAAFFVVELTGAREPVAELLGCEVGYFGGAGPGVAEGLRRCIAAALRRSGLTPAEVTVVVPGAAAHGKLARLERRAIAAEIGGPREVLDIVPTLGDAYSASGALQLAALLATTDGARPRVGLLTSVSQDGEAGALVMRC